MKAMRRFSGDYRSLAIQAALGVAAILLGAVPLRSEAPAATAGEIERIRAAMPARATKWSSRSI